MVASLVLDTALTDIDVKLAPGVCNWKFEQFVLWMHEPYECIPTYFIIVIKNMWEYAYISSHVPREGTSLKFYF